ncbi:MAG: hypothetical protein A4E57_04905 [Syntrophorhabdaceae bacterium PtaU1.Bin034]|nr:MAG: hypothetical protein A4E57_04905 [Syntrophorhabdaceae bacterium PtaU1.Bin034]
MRDQGRRLGKATAFLDAFQQTVGGVLALLYVGLIKRIYAEYGSRHRRCDLPSEKLLKDIVILAQFNEYDRKIGRLQHPYALFQLGIDGTFPVNIDKKPVVAVHKRVPERLADNRQQPRIFLPGAFCDQLFKPHAESSHALRQQKRYLILSRACHFAEGNAEQDGRILPGRD